MFVHRAAAQFLVSSMVRRARSALGLEYLHPIVGDLGNRRRRSPGLLPSKTSYYSTVQITIEPGSHCWTRDRETIHDPRRIADIQKVKLKVVIIAARMLAGVISGCCLGI